MTDGPAMHTWTIFINQWVTQAHVGLWPHERDAPQDIRITVQGTYRAPLPITQHADVVCYDILMTMIRDLLVSRHYALLETLCEVIAQQVLDDARIITAFVRLEKFVRQEGGATFGVEITRHRAEVV